MSQTPMINFVGKGHITNQDWWRAITFEKLFLYCFYMQLEIWLESFAELFVVRCGKMGHNCIIKSNRTHSLN